MFLLVIGYFVNEFHLVEFTAKHLIAYPHHLSHVEVALLLGASVKVIQRIKT